VGKSPLLKALRRFHPALAARLRTLVLYNDRQPRPDEHNGSEYYFRPRHYIEDLDGKPGYVVLPVRRDLQALEIAQVLHALDERRSPFFEGNAYIAEALMSAPELIHIPRISVFLSPLSMEEILNLRLQPDLDLETVIHELMHEKLVRRATRQKGVLSEQDLLDIEARSAAAYKEMQYAPQFDWVIPNHDGEDSDNWAFAGYPVGDARRALLDFVAILQGLHPHWAQKWPGEIFDTPHL
jgi:guanylate kinase